MGAHIVVGAQIGGEAHRLPVLLPEQRPDVGVEADRLAWSGQRNILPAGCLILGATGPLGPARRRRPMLTANPAGTMTSLNLKSRTTRAHTTLGAGSRHALCALRSARCALRAALCALRSAPPLALLLYFAAVLAPSYLLRNSKMIRLAGRAVASSRGPLACCATGQAVCRERIPVTPLTCGIVLCRIERICRACSRRSRTPGRRLFEFWALTWIVELWGFEPQTSCMPSAGRPSTAVHRRRPASWPVHRSAPSSAPVAVLPCSTPCKLSTP